MSEELENYVWTYGTYDKVVSRDQRKNMRPRCECDNPTFKPEYYSTKGIMLPMWQCKKCGWKSTTTIPTDILNSDRRLSGRDYEELVGRYLLERR